MFGNVIGPPGSHVMGFGTGLRDLLKEGQHYLSRITCKFLPGTCFPIRIVKRCGKSRLNNCKTTINHIPTSVVNLLVSNWILTSRQPHKLPQDESHVQNSFTQFQNTSLNHMFVYFIVKTVKTNHASMHSNTCWGLCLYSVGMLTTAPA